MRNAYPILVTIFLIVSQTALAQQIVKGVIFEDTNKNGKRDLGELGVAGAAVSNGIDVILSDQDGLYEIELTKEGIVFVIKPANYLYPVNDTQIPQFFYVHRPHGSPSHFRYEGFYPTGSLPESLEFPLIPIPKPDDHFRVLVFGDPQPYTQQELEWFDKAIVADVQDISGVAFGVSVGDIVGDDLTLFPGYRQVTSKLGLPWFNVMGNHDMNFDAEDDLLTSETFKMNFGPSTYAFNHGNAHILVLENILYPDPRGGSGYWGGFRKDQLDFVENSLKLVDPNALIILFMHIPLFEENGDTFRDEDRARLLQLLSPFPHTLSFSAHTHYMKQTFFSEEDGFFGKKPHHHFNVGTPSGDWYSGKWNDLGIPEAMMRDGSPKGYLYLEINGNQYTTRYKAAGKEIGYQMSIFAPKIMEEGKRNRDLLVVNFFTGHKTDKVQYRIGDGSWLPLRNTTNLDPTYLMKYYEWDLTEQLLDGRRPSYPVMTDHLWITNLPVNLPAGEHVIEVKATDMYGNEHFGTKMVRVVRR